MGKWTKYDGATEIGFVSEQLQLIKATETVKKKEVPPTSHQIYGLELAETSCTQHGN